MDEAEVDYRQRILSYTRLEAMYLSYTRLRSISQATNEPRCVHVCLGAKELY